MRACETSKGAPVFDDAHVRHPEEIIALNAIEDLAAQVQGRQRILAEADRDADGVAARPEDAEEIERRRDMRFGFQKPKSTFVLSGFSSSLPLDWLAKSLSW